MMIVHAIFEHGPLRYTALESMLSISPTILSGKLARLTDIGLIERHKAHGAKEVTYSALPIAKNIVNAYHLLEDVNDALNRRSSKGGNNESH